MNMSTQDHEYSIFVEIHIGIATKSVNRQIGIILIDTNTQIDTL